MRHLRQLCAALILACAFTMPALAGEIHAGEAPPPPPPPTLAGEMSAGLADVLLTVLAAAVSFG
jgi:hypothetical protein